MCKEMSEETYRSVYSYGARLGLRMGAWLCVMSACLLLSVKLPALILITVPMLLLIPFFLYRMMRGVWNVEPLHRTVSAQWLLGILIFAGGSLICALFTGVEMLTLQPHFFEEYMRHILTTLQAAGMASAYGEQMDILRRMLEHHIYPTPMQFAISMLWTTTFFGSLLSLFLAIVLRQRAMRESARITGF